MLRQRVWKRIVLWPGVVLPVGAGAGLLVASVVLGPVAAFVGAVGCLVGAGVLGTRALVGVEGITKDVAEQIDREERARARLRLDDLDKRLRKDGDARTEGLLRDLRVLMGQFEASSALQDAGMQRQVVEVKAKCERLSTSCVRSLERTLELWALGKSLHTPAARQGAMQQRERLIVEVEASVKHLSSILEGLHSLGSAGQDVSEMGRIRGELDATLEAARRVEDRMRDLDVELDRLGMVRGGSVGA